MKRVFRMRQGRLIDETKMGKDPQDTINSLKTIWSQRFTVLIETPELFVAQSTSTNFVPLIVVIDESLLEN